MNRFRRLTHYRLRTLFAATLVVCLFAWWFVARPREYARQQTIAGRQLIHDRDRTYLAFVFDQTVRDHLVAVIGDSRLTHWKAVRWIVCPNEKNIVSYGSDQALLVWNRDDGSIRRGFYDVIASAYAVDANICFMVTAQGTVRTWSLADDLVVEERNVPANCAHARLACSPCGKFLAYHSQSGTSGKTAIWDREAGREISSIEGNCTVITFSPDSKAVAIIANASISEYDISSGKLLSQVEVPKESGSPVAVYAAAFSATGEHFFVGDAAGRLLVYDWPGKRILREMNGTPDSVLDLSVRTFEKSADIAVARNKYFATEQFIVNPSVRTWTSVLLNEPTTAVWNRSSGVVAGIRGGRLVEMNGDVPRRMTGGPRSDATCFAFSPRGDLIALAGRDGQIIIRETSKWERVQSWRAHDGWVRRLVWSPRGDLLLSKADDNVLAAWDPRTGDELHAFSQFSTPTMNAISFDRAGKYFAGFCGGANFAIDIIDADTFETVTSISNKSLRVRGNVILSQDGHRLFAGASPVRFNLWSIDDGKVVASAGGRSGDDVKLALSEHEDVVFSADVKSVSAYDVVNGTLLWATPVHQSLISDISLHPSRALLATGGDDGMVAIVDTETGKSLKRLRLGPAKGDILQVDFSPDGQLLAVAMGNGAVVILRTPWD